MSFDRDFAPPARRTWCGRYFLGVTFLLAAACESTPTGEEPSPSAVAEPVASRAPATAVDPATPATTRAEPPPEPEPETDPFSSKPSVSHEGPYFAATRTSAGIYSEPHLRRSLKVGYLRRGSKVPIKPEPLVTSSCRQGWHETTAGGFVCGDLGTTNLDHPEVRLAVRAPNLDEVLPYQYARNLQNGTPLYRSTPSRDQMHRYEPYLPAAKAAEAQKAAAKAQLGQPVREPGAAEPDDSPSAAAKEDPRYLASRRAAAPNSPAATEQPLLSASSAAINASGGLIEPALEDLQQQEEEAPWWQKDDAPLHEVKLGQLDAEGDEILAKRMVKGFYVAVDRTFSWNDRSWYKTTKGLLAPRDRMGVATGSDFHGLRLTDEWQLPVGWTYGWKEAHSRYLIDLDKEALTTQGSLERFEPVRLTGKSVQVRKRKYWETVQGDWVRDSEIRIAEPSTPPEDLRPQERWIAINTETQTLVAYVGERPVYATLISSGKKSTDKAKDHSTPLGQWHVREKHLTTTMDGDGTAAGDLPYSIEDVPFVQYYHESYALHAAFWHSNYGVRMSHGCVNLSPLDAKALFFFSDPPVPEGWYGAWSSAEREGTRIVIHE